MNEASDVSPCPLCGHAGRKGITERPAALFPPPDLNRPLLTWYKCCVCGSTFTPADAQPAALEASAS